MYQAFKYRIYPNREQQFLIEKHFWCTRYIYNWSLQSRIAYYQNHKKTEKRFSIQSRLPALKKEHEWLKEVNSQSLQSAIENMDTAFKNFFRMKKGFPNFHKKHGHQSFHIPQSTKIDVAQWKLSIPKIKNIKTIFHREPIGEVRQSTISRTPTWKYFVSILCEREDMQPLKKNTNIVGIDVGIKDFATLSTWEKIQNHKFLKRSLKHLKKMQRKLSKCTKWSNNRNKARLRLAKIHEKISNQRGDFLHKLSTKLIRENQAVCIEDLNVKGMIRNHRLAQAISDCGWRQFRSMLEYKSQWYWRSVYMCGRFEPSSKTCTCGYINNELKLSMREWTCSECGIHHDRDILAANNIKQFALTKVGMTWCNACGDEKLFSSMKQETFGSSAGCPASSTAG